MKNQILLSFWLCALVGGWVFQHAECTNNTAGAKTVSRSYPSNTLTKCGQTVHANNGAIKYKLEKPYDADELCAFIVRFKNYGNHTFQLDVDGISDSDPNAISILDFSHSHHLGPPNVAKTVTVSGWTIIVVFKTQTNSGTGFQLSFKADKTKGAKLDGADTVYNMETPFSLQLPFTKEDLYNHYVITSGSKVITHPRKYIRLMASAVFSNIYPYCRNLVRVYTFENYELRFTADLCDDHDSVVLETKEMFIVFYHGSTVPRGNISGFLQWQTVTH
ncbi:hypothetical protein Ocin01_13555 [Orchesella cincta]|uniref:CUB domain-containing protein n=1 Tax=Orchesella cincta TaxID=48709 RepID=A0A1D2MJB8_ORCCI|nr:hypothetical protein Ocin01_13555 [Orchesella cincta]